MKQMQLKLLGTNFLIPKSDALSGTQTIGYIKMDSVCKVHGRRNELHWHTWQVQLCQEALGHRDQGLVGPWVAATPCRTFHFSTT